MNKEKRHEVTKEIRTSLCAIEVRAAEIDDKKTITGYAAKYNAESKTLRDWWGDEFVEVIADGAFDETLRSNTIKALYNHNTDHVIGSTKSGTLRLESDDVGLRFEIDLPNTQVGNDLYESVKRGDIDGNSFGFRVNKDKWSDFEKDGKKIMKRTLLEIDLFEISPTAFPAYEDTEVDCRSLEQYRSAKPLRQKNKSLLMELQYT